MTLSLAPAPTVLAEIEHLEHAVDTGLAVAVDSLTELRHRGAHTVRGHELWHSYVLDRFGDALARLRLPDGERLALVQSMCTPTADRPRGLPVREQARHLGVATNSVQADRAQLGLVTPRARPEALPAPTGRVWEQAVEHLRRAERGLTRVELAQRTGWRDGKCGGALDYLVDKHLATKSELWRDAQRVFIAVPAEDAP